jgi:hypothetical protein
MINLLVRADGRAQRDRYAFAFRDQASVPENSKDSRAGDYPIVLEYWIRQLAISAPL